MKVSVEDYNTFRNHFYSGLMPHLRLGQAFITYFKIEGVHTELFYERDDNKAITIIFERYIEETQ